VEIKCYSLDELKLLVNAIDLDIISNSERYNSGFGAAGVIVVDKADEDDMVLPISLNGKIGSILTGPDKIIVTPFYRQFSWFMDQLLHCELNEVSKVELYENEVCMAHLKYCTDELELKGKMYDIKEELVYICDFLIECVEKTKQESICKCSEK